VYNDGLWSTYVPFVATLLLTGQNLVCTALDFREREFRADRYAAASVSPAAAARAVKEIDDAQKRDDDPNVPTAALFAPLTSFVPATPDGDGTVGVFSINFGGFTMSTAHPSIEQRVDRLQLTATDEHSDEIASDPRPS